MNTLLFVPIAEPPPTNGLLKWLAIGLLAMAIPVHAQEAPSAAWYAKNDRARMEMVEQCQNHPGPARRSDDCAAAWQGNVLAAEAEARRNIGDTTPPTSPRYWQRRPIERREVLARCAGMTPEQQARWFCSVARRA